MSQTVLTAPQVKGTLFIRPLRYPSPPLASAIVVLLRMSIGKGILSVAIVELTTLHQEKPFLPKETL